MSRKPLMIACAAVLIGAAALPQVAAAATPARAELMFWFLDRNGDGKIDQSEIAAFRAEIFDTLDANHDGRVTKDEVEAAASAARANLAERLAARIKGGVGAAAAGREVMMQRLGLDTPDGVARADFIGRQTPMFARADSNGDGAVSRAEFGAALAAGQRLQP